MPRSVAWILVVTGVVLSATFIGMPAGLPLFYLGKRGLGRRLA